MTETKPLLQTVLVTRAEPGATQTTARLLAMGLLGEKLPAIQLKQIPIIFKEQNFRGGLIFTSQNGVQFAPRAPFRNAKQVFCVADATAQAARQAGFKNVQSARGDADTLIKFILENWRIDDGPLLHMGNAQPSGEIVPQLLEKGYDASFLPIYKATMHPDFENGLRTRLLSDLKLDVILVHSPMAAEFIDLALQDWPKLNTIKLPDCFAISPNAGKPLQNIYNEQVKFAPKPNEHSLLDCLLTP